MISNSNLGVKRITTEPVNGMTTNLKRSGHVVELYAYTTPDVILGTYDGWATIGVIPPNEVLFIPDHSVITRVQFANDVSGFLKIKNNQISKTTWGSTI